MKTSPPNTRSKAKLRKKIDERGYNGTPRGRDADNLSIAATPRGHSTTNRSPSSSFSPHHQIDPSSDDQAPFEPPAEESKTSAIDDVADEKSTYSVTSDWEQEFQHQDSEAAALLKPSVNSPPPVSHNEYFPAPANHSALPSNQNIASSTTSSPSVDERYAVTDKLCDLISKDRNRSDQKFDKVMECMQNMATQFNKFGKDMSANIQQLTVANKTTTQMIQEIKRPQQKVLPNRFDINNINTTDLPTTQRIINNRAASVASSVNSEDDDHGDIDTDGQETSTYSNGSLQGTNLETSIMAFKSGDNAYWKTHSSQLSQVTIKAAHMPITENAQPSYTVILLTDGSSHQVPHENLFLLSDDPSYLGDDDQKMSGMQRLTAATNPTWSPSDIIRWDAMTKTKLKLRDFKKAMDYEYLLDDSINAIEIFYININTHLEAAHSDGATILPPLDSLLPNQSFEQLLLPPTKYQHHQQAKAFFISIGTILYSALQNPKVTAKAPTARQGLKYHRNRAATGWDLFMLILTYCIPHLGATGFNVQKLIDALILNNGDDVYDFLAKAQEIHRTINLSKLRPSPNSLITQIIDQLMRSTDHRPFMIKIKSSFHQFIRKNTISTEYTNETADTILDFFLDMDAPEKAVVSLHQPTTPSSSRAILPTSGTTNASNKTGNDSDDEDSDDNEFSPEFRGINTGSYKNYQARNSSQVPPCPLCNQKHLPPRECWLRGPAFQPTPIRQKIAQYNASHGDKPKVDPDSITRVPTPRQATYKKQSTKPQPRNHNVEVADDFANIASEIDRVIKDGNLEDIIESNDEPPPIMKNISIKDLPSSFPIDNNYDDDILNVEDYDPFCSSANF